MLNWFKFLHGPLPDIELEVQATQTEVQEPAIEKAETHEDLPVQFPEEIEPQIVMIDEATQCHVPEWQVQPLKIKQKKRKGIFGKK